MAYRTAGCKSSGSYGLDAQVADPMDGCASVQRIERPYLISVRQIRRWNTIGCSRSNGQTPTVAADPTDNVTELMIGHKPNPTVSDARD